MDSRTQNHLNMVSTCITVAQEAQNKAVWQGKDPADFGTDVAKLTTDYGAVTAKVAQWEAAKGGAADDKASAETVLEDQAYLLARACYNHFKKTGSLVVETIKNDGWGALSSDGSKNPSHQTQC